MGHKFRRSLNFMSIPYNIVIKELKMKFNSGIRDAIINSVLKKWFRVHWREILGIVLLFLAFLFTHRFFFLPGDFHTHDNVHFIRLYDLDKVLHEGQFPPRWLPDLGKGFGYPFFNFYPPFAYYVGEIFHLLGFSFTAANKLSFALAGAVGTVGFFALTNYWFGFWPAWGATFMWLFLPYRAIDLYVRGSLAEYWGMNLLPLVFYFAQKLFDRTRLKNLIGFSLSLAILLISHNGVALIGSLWLGFFIIFNFISQKQLKNVRKIVIFVLGGFLALGLAAYFIFPALLEKDFTQVKEMFADYYAYYVHFPSLKQLFLSRFWGYSGSNYGTKDGMSFQIGHLHWLFVLIGAVILVGRKITRRKVDFEKLALFFGLSFLGFVFLTHAKSDFIWQKLTFLQFLQFPWRLLLFVGFISSLMGGLIFKLVEGHWPKFRFIFLGLTVFLLITFNYSYFKPEKVEPIDDEYYFLEENFRAQQWQFITDYLPAQATELLNEFYRDPLVLSEVGEAEILYNRTTEAEFIVDARDEAEVVIKRLYFPGWRLEIKDQPDKYTVSRNGFFVVPVKKGRNQIKIYLENTSIRFWANMISLVSLVILGLLVILIRRLRRRIP